MAYEITGRVHEVSDEKRISDKFTIKEFVVRTENAYQGKVYEKFLQLQLANEGIAKLDGVKAGDEVRVKFDLESRAWNGRYFTTAKAFGIEILTAAPERPTAASMTEKAAQPSGAYSESSDAPEGDLPF